MNESGLKRIPQFEAKPKSGYFKISGRSYPENVAEVFESFVLDIRKYLENPQEQTRLDINLEFCSTSTTKKLIEIFEILDQLSLNNKSVQIQWFCEQDDEDKQELGEDLKTSTKSDFSIILV